MRGSKRLGIDVEKWRVSNGTSIMMGESVVKM